MSTQLPKTVLLAIATLLFAVAALVADVISPHADSTHAGGAVTRPAQVLEVPAPSPLRAPVRTGQSDVAAISSHPAS